MEASEWLLRPESIFMIFDPLRTTRSWTTMVFNKVVKPYFLRYEKVLDKHLANLPEDAKKYMQNVKDSDAVKNVMTMTKEQADKLIAEHGPEVMDKMMKPNHIKRIGLLKMCSKHRTLISI